MVWCHQLKHGYVFQLKAHEENKQSQYNHENVLSVTVVNIQELRIFKYG